MSGAAAGPARHLATLGRTAAQVVGEAGALARLAASAAVWAATGPFRSRVIRPGLYTRQMERVGAQSAPLVLLVAALIGAILVLQTAATLRAYGQVGLVPKMVALSLVRELGPLICGLILAGRVGAAFTAEIGTMVVSEEVQALETIGVDPVGYLVGPRLVACLTMVPCLTLLADAVGMCGAFGVAWLELGIDAPTYLQQSRTGLSLRDLLVGEAKSVVFGGIIAITACRRALAVRGASDAVGRATMQSVVTAMVLIIGADCVFTAVVSAWQD